MDRGRSAIITGGASGIGRALAEELALAGVRVTLADRQAALAEEVAASICARGGAAAAAELDVRDLTRFREVVENVYTREGHLDLLFNNAGIGVGGEMRDYDAADWDDVIDVNLRGVAHGILAAYPRMVRQGSGHIVNTASMAGLVAGPLQGSYSATKYAVVGLSKALRIEAKPYGVKVSVFCPGVIRTPILAGGRYGRFKVDVDPKRVAANFERLRPMDPNIFARKVLRAIQRNDAIIIEPAWWRLFWWADRIFPRLGERLGEAFLRRTKRDFVELGRQ